MVEELKHELRKLENLIGCQEKVDPTSKTFKNQLIRSLLAKYENDLENSLRLHRLELFYELIEQARRKEQKSADVEEKFVLSKDEEVDEDKGDESEENLPEVDEKKPITQEEEIAVRPEDIDNWKDLMTLQKVYYVLEHPNSQGLTWRRRVSKKKTIPKYTDKDFIEWRVAQLFRLRSLEEWALSRGEARKLADESPYNFEEILEDNESRELEDMFQILDTQKQKKPEMTPLRKILRTKRPFKLQDEGVEDWTESYSEDSEESGASEIDEEVFEIPEETDFEIGETDVTSEKSEFDEESSIFEIFSSYKEVPPYKNPVMDLLKEAPNMREWYNLCQKNTDKDVIRKDVLPKLTVDEIEDEDSISVAITQRETSREKQLRRVLGDQVHRTLKLSDIEAIAEGVVNKTLNEVPEEPEDGSFEESIVKDTLDKLLIEVLLKENVSSDDEISNRVEGISKSAEGIKVGDEDDIIVDKTKSRKIDDDSFTSENFIDLPGKVLSEQLKEDSNLLPGPSSELEREKKQDVAEIISKESKRSDAEDTLQETEVNETKKIGKDDSKDVADAEFNHQMKPSSTGEEIKVIATNVDSLEEVQKEEEISGTKLSKDEAKVQPQLINEDLEKEEKALKPGELSSISPTPFQLAEESVKRETFTDVNVDELNKDTEHVEEIFTPALKDSGSKLSNKDTFEQSLKADRSKEADISNKKGSPRSRFKRRSASKDTFKTARGSVEKVVKKSSSSINRELAIKRASEEGFSLTPEDTESMDRILKEKDSSSEDMSQ